MGQTTILGRRRLFTAPKSKAYDQIKWVKRDSVIMNPMTGKPVFEQLGVDFPEGWSLNAINIVAQKYFSGTPGTPEREDSMKKLVDRVVDTVTRQGVQEGYFEADEEAEDFREELKYILATQRAAFNHLYGSISVLLIARSKQAPVSSLVLMTLCQLSLTGTVKKV